jgi:hypothetical protein
MTGVIAVNHVMEDPDGEHEKGTVPTQVQSMAGKTVLGPIQKQLLKHATHQFDQSPKGFHPRSTKINTYCVIWFKKSKHFVVL